jgi:hypothetical protein
MQKTSFRRVEETINKVFNQNTKNVGTFQFKRQVKKNITTFVVLFNIPKNI